MDIFEKIKKINIQLKNKILLVQDNDLQIDLIQIGDQWFKFHFKKNDLTYMFSKNNYIQAFNASLKIKSQDIINEIQKKNNKIFIKLVDLNKDQKMYEIILDKYMSNWKETFEKIEYFSNLDILTANMMSSISESVFKNTDIYGNKLSKNDIIIYDNMTYYFTGRYKNSSGEQIWCKAIDSILKYGVLLNNEKLNSKKIIKPSKISDFDDQYCILTNKIDSEIIAEAILLENEDKLIFDI